MLAHPAGQLFNSSALAKNNKNNYYSRYGSDKSLSYYERNEDGSIRGELSSQYKNQFVVRNFRCTPTETTSSGDSWTEENSSLAKVNIATKSLDIISEPFEKALRVWVVGDNLIYSSRDSKQGAYLLNTLTSNGAGTLTVTTGGTENLVLSTNSGTNSGTITITDGANGDITLAPNGTGKTDFNDNAITGYGADLQTLSGTSKTLAATDNGTIIVCSSNSAVTIIVPSSLPSGFNCMIIQSGSGQVSLSASSTTLNNRNGSKTAGQHAIMTIVHLGSDTFVVSGDTTS